MIAKILPAIIALAGLGGGVGAGIALRAAPQADAAETCSQPADAAVHDAAEGAHTLTPPMTDAKDPAAATATEFVEIDSQFIIPVIEQSRVSAMVILSLTLEVAEGQAAGTRARLPKLRDRFLRVMLDHANVGGFSGTFTADGSVEQLRRNLVEVGRKELGAVLTDVLILDMNRQAV